MGISQWTAFELIFLILTIIAIWYLRIAIKFYKSEKEEGKIIKISSWINIINIPIIVYFLIAISIGLLKGGRMDPIGLAIVLMLNGMVILGLFLISFILFLIGKRKTNFTS